MKGAAEAAGEVLSYLAELSKTALVSAVAARNFPSCPACEVRCPDLACPVPTCHCGGSGPELLVLITVSCSLLGVVVGLFFGYCLGSRARAEARPAAKGVWGAAAAKGAITY